MKKIFASIISILLCLCMLVPTVSLVSFAAKLGQVKNLKATSNETTSITLKWDSVSGASGYRVYIYSSSKGKWVYEKSVKKNTTTVSDLTSAKAYKFRVRAYKGSENKTFGAYSPSLNTATKPTQVKNLSASGITTTAFTLNWSAVKRATGYRVYVYDVSSSTWKKIGTTSTTKCKISGLSAGGKYKFKACAYFNNGTKDFVGKYSSVLTVASKPAKVTGLTLMASTQNTVTLAWNKVTGATEYQIYKYVNGSWSKIVTTTANSCTLSATTTPANYKVRACVSVSGAMVYGEFSAALSAAASEKTPTKVNVKAPTNLSLANNTEKKCIEIKWSSVSGATGYQIETYDYSNGTWKNVGTSASASYNYPVTTTATYYFRVRAYKTVDSKTYYSDYTPASGIEYTAPGNPNDESLSDLERYGILGYMYDFKEGCFYNTVDAIHRVAGFSPIYDVFGPFAFCFYTTVRIDFTYSGHDWRIQLWKGQYGPCFVGGEAGVYTRKAGMDIADYYVCASNENMLQMSMVVYQNGRKLFTRPYGYYWWCTGYVFGLCPTALGSIVGAAQTDDLTMLLRITFKSPTMTALFCEAAEKEGFKPGTTYVVSGNDVILTWN